MGKTDLLRRKAKMILLQPHLGDSRRQELRNSPFWPTSLFKSQSRMEKTSSFKKGTPNDSQGFGPYQNKPFRGPHHNKKRGSYRKRPYEGFPQVGGNRTTEASEIVFDCIQGARVRKTLPPMTPYKPPSVHQ